MLDIAGSIADGKRGGVYETGWADEEDDDVE